MQSQVNVWNVMQSIRISTESLEGGIRGLAPSPDGESIELLLGTIANILEEIDDYQKTGKKVSIVQSKIRRA